MYSGLKTFAEEIFTCKILASTYLLQKNPSLHQNSLCLKSVSVWHWCNFIYAKEVTSTFQNVIFREKIALKIDNFFQHFGSSQLIYRSHWNWWKRTGAVMSPGFCSCRVHISVLFFKRSWQLIFQSASLQKY